METKIICPLGSHCEEAKDGKLLRCAWYVQLQGKNPQSEEMINEWRCAMAWMPLMMVENAQSVRGMSTATESFRNEMTKGLGSLNSILLQASGARKEIKE